MGATCIGREELETNEQTSIDHEVMIREKIQQDSNKHDYVIEGDCRDEILASLAANQKKLNRVIPT
jgi:hypothetical protein